MIKNVPNDKYGPLNRKIRLPVESVLIKVSNKTTHFSFSKIRFTILLGKVVWKNYLDI